jgi:protein-L-isoaspartate(D-aspartate) O-methyltransferase
MEGRERPMPNAASSRLAMMESQVRPNQVTDRRLLAAMGTLPREIFVPEDLSGLAYMEDAIEVFPAIDGAPARYLLAPMVLARLLQLASVEPHDRVLDVGCGTGYSTALLASLGQSVVGLEPEPELAGAARRNLTALGIANAEIVSGSLPAGWPDAAPYDVIVLNGSVPEPPEGIAAQLAEGGRMVFVRASQKPGVRTGKACLFVKVDGEASGLAHFDAGAPLLPGFEPAPHFVF